MSQQALCCFAAMTASRFLLTFRLRSAALDGPERTLATWKREHAAEMLSCCARPSSILSCCAHAQVRCRVYFSGAIEATALVRRSCHILDKKSSSFSTQTASSSGRVSRQEGRMLQHERKEDQRGELSKPGLLRRHSVWTYPVVHITRTHRELVAFIPAGIEVALPSVAHHTTLTGSRSL